MRKKRLEYNTLFALLNNIITILCGLVLPKFILETYGSNVNGLVNSISKFLGFISFFELGVGAVIQSALYMPLVQKNNIQISKIVISGNRFFRMLAKILVVYIIILLIVYPSIINHDYNYLYTDILIIVISISMFAQYYFGQVNRILISADQRGYIYLIVESACMIINTVISVMLMKARASIQLVKLFTSLIYLTRPIILYFYVQKHYNIDRTIKVNDEPLRQKKNGIAQHIAIFVIDGTDIIILTMFSTLANVSIYYIYSIVVNGVKAIALAASSGMQSLLGELVAKKEEKDLINTFAWYEWISHSIVTVIFGCCTNLIVSFVRVYTLGINDANYNVPLFGFIISIASMVYCLGLPYNNMILACNVYKETQNYFIVTALINVLSSLLFVNIGGLIGVAAGTLLAMVYQNIWMIIYNSKKLINWPIVKTIKQYIVDAIILIIGYLLSSLVVNPVQDYWSWGIIAIKVTLIYSIVWIFSNFIVYRNYMKRLLKMKL